MKEKLYTIPLNDAINANDECPFCYVWRELEQNQIDFVLGSSASYMVSEIREITDKEGFCKEHFKKMYDYGNTLGNAWILKTHYMRMRDEFEKTIKKYHPGKQGLAEKILKKSDTTNPITNWIDDKEKSCFICNKIYEIFDRYIDTFFILWNQDDELKNKIKNGKGFCLSHFKILAQEAGKRLTLKEEEEFFDILIPIMRDNLNRIQEDVNWLIDKFDYKNKDADWKNSKDAVTRGMQKLKGGYPVDLPYHN